MNKIVIKFTAIFLAFTLLLGTSEISFHALSTGNTSSSHSKKNDDNDEKEVREKHKRDHVDAADSKKEKKLSQKHSQGHKPAGGGPKVPNEDKLNFKKFENFEKKEFVDNTVGHVADLNLYGEESMKNAKALAATKALDISDGSITISKNTADENKIDILQGSTIETISKLQAIEIKQVKATEKTTNKISIEEGVCTEKKPLNLVLNNVKIDAIDASDNAITIGSNSHVNIVKDGTNTLHGAKDAINAGEESSVIFSGRGSLTATAAKDEDKNGSIYVNGNIRVENGTLNATKAGTTVEGGISAAGTITVLGGSKTKLTAKGTEVGLYSKGDMHINASVVNAASKNSSAISADACVMIDKADVNAESEATSGIDSINEDVKISSGNINAKGKNYGIHSCVNMNLAGGKITANASNNDGIYSGGVMQLGNAEIEAHGGTGDAASAVFSGESLYILGASLKAVAEHGGAVVAAYLNMSSGSIDASGDGCGVYGNNGIDISGGNVQASADHKDWCAAIYGGGDYYGGVNISGKNTVVNVKASTTSTEWRAYGIFAYGINISGATVKAESFAPYKCTGICSDYYDININADADVNADAKVSAAEEYEAYADGIYVYCGNVNINANVTANANIDMGDLENPYTEAYGILAENDCEEDYPPEAAGNITINGGNIKSKVNIASKNGVGLAAAINTGYYDYDAYNACNGGDITINGGNLDLSCEGTEGEELYYDGIAAYQIYYDYEGVYGGNVNVNAGNINITAGSDGIDVDEDANISGGTFDITAYDVGIDAGNTNISGGTFNITADDDGIYAGNTNISGGTFNITANYGIYTWYDANISGGTFNITADWNGIYVDEDANISGGTFDITAYDCGIYAGNTNISGGTFNITANYGIYTYDTYISGGTFNITAYDNGIDACDTEISGGTFDITADDDGICTYEDANISGGTFNITADSDGIYADGDAEISNGIFDIKSNDAGIETNGNLTISDGEIKINSGRGIFCEGTMDIRGGEVEAMSTSDEYGALTSYKQTSALTKLKKLFLGEEGMSFPVTGYAFFEGDTKDSAKVKEFIEPTEYIVGETKDSYYTTGKYVRIVEGTAVTLMVGKTEVGTALALQGSDHLTEVNLQGGSAEKGYYNNENHDKEVAYSDGYFLQEVPGYTDYEGHWNDINSTDKLWVDANKYKIQYSANYGDTPATYTPADVEFTYGEDKNLMSYDDITKLEGNTAFKREGFTFNGWNTKADGTGTTYADEANAGNIVTNENNATVTLYAQWVADTYEVTFHVNDGVENSYKTEVAYNANLPSYETICEANNAFIRKEFTFTGWNTKADGTGTSLEDEAKLTLTSSTGKIDLYAQWEEESSTLTYKSEDAKKGSVSLLSEVVAMVTGKAKGSEAIPNKGYSFDGWYDSKGNKVSDNKKLEPKQVGN